VPPLRSALTPLAWWRRQDLLTFKGNQKFNVLVDNRAAARITQGVTTEITGEGTSIAPLNDRLLEDLKDNAKKYGVKLDWRST